MTTFLGFLFFGIDTGLALGICLSMLVLFHQCTAMNVQSSGQQIKMSTEETDDGATLAQHDNGLPSGVKQPQGTIVGHILQQLLSKAFR